ncbi:MAG: phage tail protein [Peptoanaerobacter stomatis]|uniref:phage tail protein n=1 Tax=Peptoanaerobacter stomatis TaxID=796937 RepID=UPI003FA130BF
MATELGKAFVQIVPSARGIGGAISNILDGEAQSAGNIAGQSIGSSLIGMLKKTLAIAGIGKLIGSALTEGGELEQSIGGVETLFKNNADMVKKYAQDAYKTVGVSANDYMSNVTSFSASLLQSTAGDTKKAAEVAHMAMVDMSDNANKMGSDISSIQTAYQGFAKQNYTMLDNLKLGYGGTKKEMERLLVDAQKLTGVKYNIDNLSDVYSAIHAIQGEIGITGTTAKEASETLQGSFSAMKSAFQNVLGSIAIGENIEQSLQGLVETTSTFLFNNFIPMVVDIVKNIPVVIFAFIQSSAPLFMQGGIDLITQLSEGIINGYPEALSNFSSAIINMLDSITEKLPEFLEKGIEIIKNLANGLMSNIPQLINTVGNVLSKIVEFILVNLPVILNAGKDILFSIASGIINNLPAIGESILKLISKIISTFIANYPNLVKSGYELIGSVLGGIIEKIPDVIVAIAKLTVSVLTEFAKLLPNLFVFGIDMLVKVTLGIASMTSKLIGSGINAIMGLLSAIGELVINFFKYGGTVVTNIANGITDGSLYVIDSIKHIISDVIDEIKSWFGDFKDAGANIVNMIADGIKGAIGTVTDAIGDVVSSVRNYLPFSPAKEGPLRDLNKLDFTIIADGINSAKKSVLSSTDDLMSSVRDSLNPTSDLLIDGNLERNISANLNKTNLAFDKEKNTEYQREADYSSAINQILSSINTLTQEIRNQPYTQRELARKGAIQ